VDVLCVCVGVQEVLRLSKVWEGEEKEAGRGGGMPMLAHAHVARAHAELNHWRQAEEHLIYMEVRGHTRS
jgi:hypothetical protein